MAAALFDKILIANRGEIACRIVRTARAMGYRTVAVFSEADADALHVKSADEAVYIGASPPPESYLKIEAILDAARRTSAGAVHPGYGFLAENPDFAEACEAAGLTFIGPPANVIRALGDKASAKAYAAGCNVPCVPGYFGEDQSDRRLSLEAERIGFPLIIKAVAGGGGRGIRPVAGPGSFEGELHSARREAMAAFGDARLMLEKKIEEPRHIEVQIFGDAHGNVVHLFERDCTVQRRRQKIIEEAPSPVLDDALREKITASAVAIARAVRYRNAGTVEFISDRDSNFYFLEVNTRLQVEHPVTEMLTGIDLVEWQLRVASEEPLPLTQDKIERKGHAIEIRLCAEDPANEFAPQTGRIELWRPPAGGGIRVDSGIEEGGAVSPFYDSMIAKVIAHGASRAEAARKLRHALTSAPLLGLRTNQALLSRLLASKEFREATLSATSLDDWARAGHVLLRDSVPSREMIALAAAIFANGSKMPFMMKLDCNDGVRGVSYRPGADGASILEFDGDVSELRIEET
ncbi:MAG TPA: biotin carboxylase N-terminal domain-containing protein, partial [Hyphomicrobiales bacterium]|nr:biotin carboxylase N-terminal domain-containing protein [Hyphomicrobiales bacterium]